MNKIFFALLIMAALTVAGCKSTVTHYDEHGKITKIEETTNFSRAMDGTNQKSQMVLIDGTLLTFEASASAGENCTPGVSTKFARGKTAIVNAKDGGKFTNADKVVEKFFQSKISAGKEGITAE